MKRFTLLNAAISVCASLLFTGHSLAQIPGSTPAGMGTAMIKLFGEHPAFTADVETSVTGSSRQPLRLTLTMACLGKRMRSEVDLNKVSGGGMPAQTVAQMKHLGIDRVVSIIRSDKETITLIYPNLRAYTELPMTEGDTDKKAKEPRMEQAVLAKETVEGHPCLKSRVTITDEKKQKQEILVWNATDMKNFPVKMQMDATGNEITMLYKHIKFTKPDTRQFEPPAGYTKYADQLQIMEKAAQRMMSGNSSANQK